MSGLWWKIFKQRQTELGEYPGFEDEAFSSYGPVTEYHGTVFAPEIDRGGLQGNVISHSRAVEQPEGMEGKPLVHTTPNKKSAQKWAEQRAKKFKGEPRVVAVRGQGLNPGKEKRGKKRGNIFDDDEVRVHTPNIPRERLVVQKEAKSPKALAHKHKYETEYESSPARKKYRRELEGERRKRGVAGKGGKDMSHTKTGKIVPEDPHTNRARSHPSVGSTLKMVVVKAPQMNLSGESAECELCGVMMNAQETAVSNQQMGASVCTACLMQEQQKINQQRDDAMVYHGEPMDIAMRLLKDFNTCYQCGQTWEQLGLTNALPIQRSLHEDRCMGMATSEKDSMFRQQ